MISILCPTRLRPERLRTMVDSAFSTATHYSIEILCYVTPDDESYVESSYPGVEFVHGPRITLSDIWNALIPYASGDIFMQCADDVVFITPGWDKVVEQAFAESEDKILLCFGDDLGPRGKIFSSLPFVHRKWYETLGYFTGPGFSNEWSDTWPWEVATMIGRTKLLPIEIEHRHWLWGKATRDQTYQENIVRDLHDNNAALYARRAPERLADARKLMAVMK